jgi:hypothetical protein
MVVIFIAKCFISYWMWTTWVYTPGDASEPLEVMQLPYATDTESAITSVQGAVAYWQANGLSPIPDSYYLPTNHRLPVHILALPCYLSRPYSEVAIPWNAFYSLLTAAAVLGIAHRMGLSRSAARAVFYFALAMPFSWLTSGFFKDILLQACMAVVLLAMLSSANRWYIFAPVAVLGALLLYGFRLPYMLATLVTAVYTWAARRRSSVLSPRVMLGALALLLLLSNSFIVQSYYADVRAKYEKAELADDSVRPLDFASGPFSPVKRVMVGLLTPFPWTQPFEQGPVAYSQVAEYAQATVTLALLMIVVPAFLIDLRDAVMPPATVVFALTWMLVGISGADIHSGYVQVAAIFLLPYAFQKGSPRIGRALLKSVFLMIIGNGVWLCARWLYR